MQHQGAEIEVDFEQEGAEAAGYSIPAFHTNDFRSDFQILAREKYVIAVQNYKADHNVDEGIQFLEEGRQLDPQNLEIVMLSEQLKSFVRFRGEARTDFFDEDYDQARLKIQRCIAIVQDIQIPNFLVEAKMLMKLSVIEHKVGDSTSALRYINKSIHLNRAYLNAFLHRAYLHRLNNDWDKTIKDLQAAKKIDSHMTNNPYDLWINEAKIEAKKQQNGKSRSC